MGSGKTYLSVYGGELVLQYDKREDLEKKIESLSHLGLDPDNIQERKKAKGKNEGQPVYYYVIYDVEGLITDIKIDEKDWGDMVEVEITDVDEKFVVQLGDVFSRTVKDFARRLGNLDLSKEVVFGVWSMTAEETGKSARSGVKMYQDDVKVEYFVVYDDMPAPVQKKKGRKTEWDYSEQEAYLYEVLDNFVEENFAKVTEKLPEPKQAPSKPKRASEKTARKPRAKADIQDDVEDDLPF